MNVKFTKHALKRVYQRLTLRIEAVAELFNREYWVDIGTEPGTTRVHCLFLSPYDRECFVAIMDSASDVVITVLPIEYHEQLSWKVLPLQLEIAFTFKSRIKKMLRELYPRDGHKEVQKEKTEHIPLSPSVFRVTALYHVPPEGAKVRVIRMGSIQSATYNNDIKFFIGHENFKNEIESLCKSKGMQFDCVEVVNVSFGNSDDVIEIVKMW